MAITSFTKEVRFSSGYRRDADKVVQEIKGFPRYRDAQGIPRGWTATNGGVDEAIKYMTKDKNSRLNDNAVRKLVILLTDGGVTHYNKSDYLVSCDNIKKLPAILYSIAVKNVR